MNSTEVLLHGGPLDGQARAVPAEEGGEPADRFDFEYDDGALWYIEYRKDRRGDDGWHFLASGIEKRADEE